jgi:hypothetical protein
MTNYDTIRSKYKKLFKKIAGDFNVSVIASRYLKFYDYIGRDVVGRYGECLNIKYFSEVYFGYIFYGLHHN